MSSVSNPTLVKYNSLPTDDQAAVRWGIWVLGGMREELGYSERIISTNPSDPSIEKAMRLFEANGRNITPPQVKQTIDKISNGFFFIRNGMSGKYSVATQAFSEMDPLSKEILKAVLITDGHSNNANLLDNPETTLYSHLLKIPQDNMKASNIYCAVMKMREKITS